MVIKYFSLLGIRSSKVGVLTNPGLTVKEMTFTFFSFLASRLVQCIMAILDEQYW